MEIHNNVFDFLLRMFLVLETCTELKMQQHNRTAAASAAASSANDMEQLQNDDYRSYGMDADDNMGDDVAVVGGGVSKHIVHRDMAAGKEKLVIAAAPQSLQNCNDELNNCKRINRERLCKLEFYKTYCCLTCHGYH